MNDVAILIPCFNSALTLSETLESIVSQKALLGATLILLDGGSTDFSKQIYEHYSAIYNCFAWKFRVFQDIHPAERINIVLKESEFNFYFLCHSDDIYIPSAMLTMLKYLASTDLWAVGSQNGYFQHPVDASQNNTLPYVGQHVNHPLRPDQIYCEMQFWWAINWNTILLKGPEIVKAGITLDPEKFKFCNDYRFNWELAKKRKIANVEYMTVLTRHRNSGDGPLNQEFLREEVDSIQNLIRDESGLHAFLGQHLSKVLKSISYCYGGWTLENPLYPAAHYYILADRLEAFSRSMPRVNHFERLSEQMRVSIKDTER